MEQQQVDARGFFSSLFDFSFASFITTKIIKILYIIAIIGAGIGGLFILFGGFASKSFLGVLGGLIFAPTAFILYVILARVWMEILIVMFRIAENTDKIAGKGESSQA